MRPDVDFGVGFCGKGAILLGATFRDSVVGLASSRSRDTWLWLAQQSNHLPFSKPLDGRTITVHRGEWFGTWKYLCDQLGISKGTLRIVLAELELLQAITVEPVERRQRYKNRTVNGLESEPFNGSEIEPQRSGNRTDVRCLGTLVKVHGWREIASRPAEKSNGSKIDPLNRVPGGGVGAPRLTAAQRAVNEQAMASIQSGAI
jgi:hypothetical protein